MTWKIALGAAIAGLLGVVVYAYWRQQQPPQITETGSALPDVLQPTTGPTAPRARASTRDVAMASGGGAVGTKGTSRGHEN